MINNMENIFCINCLIYDLSVFKDIKNDEKFQVIYLKN